MLRESTVRSQGLSTSTRPETTIIFGNGQSSSTHRQAQLGELEAIVCADQDLHEDLISVNPLLDKGFKLTMEADRGELTNAQSGVSIGVIRQGARWSVDLDDLAAASATIPDLEQHHQISPIVQANAVIYAIPKSLREKVISLHERMGHANTQHGGYVRRTVRRISGVDSHRHHTDSGTEGDEAISMYHLPLNQTTETADSVSVRGPPRHPSRLLHLWRYRTSQSASQRWEHLVLPVCRCQNWLPPGLHRQS